METNYLSEMRQSPNAKVDERLTFRFLIWVVLTTIAALILRFVWIFHWPLSIESEGVYYARIAENLITGRGYVGAREAGKQLLYAPLHPMLIAFVMEFARNSELAGRIVSVICGSLWIAPLMFITRSVSHSLDES